MLDIEKLERVRKTVREKENKIIRRCPACAEDGADRGGEHLAYWPQTGKFACVANRGDKSHYRRIWALVGVPEERRKGYRPSQEDSDRRRNEEREERRQKALATAAQRQAERIFRTEWEPADIWSESGVILDGETPDWRLMLEALYQPEDVLWIGGVRDSGPGFESHFRSVSEWLETESESPPFPMTSPDIFSAGVCRRSAACVTASPYIVIEADETLGRKPENEEERAENIRRNLSVLRWLKEEADWNLRAIVHTGGKSCHGWFVRPPEGHIRELRAIAPALGIDASVFSPAHPVRLPGVRHRKTGHLSRLLYLTGE